MASSARLVALFAILAVCLLQARAQEEEVKETVEGDKDSKITEDAVKQEKFFIASHFTTTFTALSTFLSVQPYFCVLASSAQACSGRGRTGRRRRLAYPKALVKLDSAVELDTSGDLEGVIPEASDDAVKNEKFFFTVWKTTTTTATVTSLSTNFSITISISARCTHANFGTIPLCG